MDVGLPDGRRLRVHDTGSGELTLLWQHGSPQTGALLDPLVEAAGRRGIRLVSYARPSYGGSSPNPGRDVASAAGDVRHVMDALGIERFATMGHSGGGPHVLACAALMPERVIGAVSISGIGPYTDEFDWYAGMADAGGLRSAAQGRDARARYAATAQFDPEVFTAADWAALEGDWAAMGKDANAASQAGPDGEIDDDVAFTSPWGFDLAGIEVPVLVVQGGEDRIIPQSHGERLTRACPSSEFWLRPRDGHISVLHAVPEAMDWLRAR